MKISLFLNLKSIFLNLFLVCFALLLTPATSAYGMTQVSYTITVTASVGEPKLTLFGYTSPFAQVKLEGIGVARETQSNKEGYFYFDRVFLPSPYPELYLLTVDTDNRVSSPVILPSLPVGPYEISVGPVLMSPTITLEKGKYLPNEQIVASGQTTPLSEVTVNLANQKSGNFWKKLFFLSPFSFIFPTQTYAYFIPKYQITSDENGRFQFNLPTSSQIAGVSWKVFAAVSFLDSPSPKSNTLNFHVLNLWQWLVELVTGLILALFGLIRPYGLALFIVFELLLILWLLRQSLIVHNDTPR